MKNIGILLVLLYIAGQSQAIIYPAHVGRVVLRTTCLWELDDVEGVEEFIEKDAKSYGRRLIVDEDADGLPRLLVFSKCGELIKEICIKDYNRRDIKRILKHLGLKRRIGKRRRRKCRRDVVRDLYVEKPKRRCYYRREKRCWRPRRRKCRRNRRCEDDCDRPRRRPCRRRPRCERPCYRRPRYPRPCRERKRRQFYERRCRRKRWRRFPCVGSQLEE